MKKTLIALALTALPVASMADVVLYGEIKAGVEVTKTRKIEGTTTQIVDYGSRIGFKGHEHLNNDLNAIWQVETDISVAGSETSLGDRDSFIGLQSKSFGTVKAGNLSTPVKNVNDKLDVWEYNDDAYRSAAGLSTFTRESQAVDRKLAISYTTPEFAGVTATAYVAPSENSNGEDAANRKRADYATYGLGFSYNNAGVFADLAGVVVKNPSENRIGKDGYHYVAQVGYEADSYMLGLAYQQARNTDIAKETPAELNVRSKEVAVTGTYNATEALRLKASAAYGFDFEYGDVKMGGNGKYQQAIVGADYALSKRTQVNAQVGHLRVGKGEQRVAETTGSFGLAHKF